MPPGLVLPSIDVVPYLNVYSNWLSENLPMLLAFAGGMGVITFAFHKAKSFLFG